MTVRERIIEQATEMFLRSGIKAITMDDIAREAGVSKRTIYENFKDKDDLLRNCLFVIDQKYTKEHESIIENSENIIHMVIGLMKLGIKAIDQINPLFFDDLKRYHIDIWNEVYKISAEKQRAQTLSILRKGINQKVFRKEIDLEIVTILLMEQLRIMPDKRIFPYGKFPQRVIFENVIVNFFRGIATQKGLDLIDGILSEGSNNSYKKQ